MRKIMNYLSELSPSSAEVLQGLLSPSALHAFQLEPSLKCLRAINELVRFSNHIITAWVRYQTLNFQLQHIRQTNQQMRSWGRCWCERLNILRSLYKWDGWAKIELCSEVNKSLIVQICMPGSHILWPDFLISMFLFLNISVSLRLRIYFC